MLNQVKCVLLVVLQVCLWGPVASSVCGSFGVSGTSFDLSSLSEPSTWSYSNNYAYYWSFCGSVTIQSKTAPVIQTVGSDVYRLAGSSYSITGLDSGIQFTYSPSYSDTCPGGLNRQTTIVVQCDYSNTEVISAVETSMCQYVITVKSPAACPSSCSAGQGIAKPGALCSPCPSGFVSDGDSLSCSICDAGSIPSFDQSVCVACPLGTYSTTAGSSHCIPCDPGFYSNNNQASPTSCKICPPGTFSSLPGQSVCEICLPNTYSEKGSSSCSLCSNHMHSSAGSKSCALDTGIVIGIVAAVLVVVGGIVAGVLIFRKRRAQHADYNVLTTN